MTPADGLQAAARSVSAARTMLEVAGDPAPEMAAELERLAITLRAQATEALRRGWRVALTDHIRRRRRDDGRPIVELMS